MEVVIPCFLSSPSTPKRFGQCFFMSAPTSPRRLSEFYNEFDDFSVTSSASAVPFDWEEKPGTPKSPKPNTTHEDDFAFHVNEESKKATLPAEELFYRGKIRPLKPPPSSIHGVFSPRKKKELDPFETAVENTRNRTRQERGRERVSSFSSSSSGRRGARSVSPYRVSKYPWEEEQQQQQQQQLQQKTEKNSIISSSSKSNRKWRLTDLFLFRSASEGRAADRDPLRKYLGLFRRQEHVKNSSFRSVEGSGSGSGSKRRGPVSAHELHYTMNRAVSEDLKKKTFLPYKQGILGRLAFNPAVHALANGFGLSHK